MKQVFANKILMVRPASFSNNVETAADNHFQKLSKLRPNEILSKALAEFDVMLQQLRRAGIDVTVVQGSKDPDKPDAIFPNNWFSCMDGKLTLYPMRAANRRLERERSIIDIVHRIVPALREVDLTSHENEKIFLEGTGSMVIDHLTGINYACISERTNRQLLERFASDNDYKVCAFDAADESGRMIYHTNVLMCIGAGFAIVCMDAVGKDDQSRVRETLANSGLQLIEISFAQMNAFAGNMLQLQTAERAPLLVMSTMARSALSADQLNRIRSFTEILAIDIPTIEMIGGGGVRCMMAELFPADAIRHCDK